MAGLEQIIRIILQAELRAEAHPVEIIPNGILITKNGAIKKDIP